MREKRNLEIGDHFGQLEVLDVDTKVGKRGQIYYLCKCSCGKTLSVVRSNLLSGHTKSCGCLVGKENPSPLKDRDPLYKTWANAKTRCYNPKSKKYHRYGARGIRMCDEWLHDFPAFYKWANANGYKPGLQLDRRDNDGNYCPENCRFVTQSENMRNTSINHPLMLNGETKLLEDWGKELQTTLGIDKTTIYQRLNKLHWSVERALTEPNNHPKSVAKRLEQKQLESCEQPELVQASLF